MLGCSAGANINNDRSEREGSGAEMDGEKTIFTRGPTGGGEK
jgi:hypothetical protein